MDARLDPSYLPPFESSEYGLLEWLASHMTPIVIEILAQSDYGHQADEHRAAINEILKAGQIAEELGWVPMEACRLTRWSTPPTNGPNDPEVTAQHLARLFACLVLLRDGPSDGSPADTLAPLTESAMALGEEPAEKCLRFVCWLIRRPCSPDHSRAFELCAAALLEGFLLRRRLDAVLSLEHEDSSKRTNPSGSADDDQWEWLLELEPHFTQRHPMWRQLIDRVFADPVSDVSIVGGLKALARVRARG